MNKVKPLVESLKWWLAVPAAILAAWLVVGKLTGVVHWGDRISAVEKSTSELSVGQGEISRRVDMMSADVIALKNDVAKNSERNERGQQTIIEGIAKITGSIQGLMESSARLQEKVASANQKAIDAAVKVDGVETRLLDHLVEQKEKK